MTVQAFIRTLLPKDDKFFALMEKQSLVLHEGAVALAKFTDKGANAHDIALSVQELEHQGDALMHQVEEALEASFVTPIDREDIQRVAVRSDDVLDLLNHTARSFDLYGVEAPSPPMSKQMALLLDGTELLKTTLIKLRQADYGGIRDANREIKKIEKEGDRIFREAVAQLFRDPSIDAKILVRDKELLESLEEALDACEDLGELLAHLAVKNG